MTTTQSDIWITTRRYSAVLARILCEYQEGATVRIDGTVFSEADMNNLLQTWCSNTRIRATRNFSLERGHSILFGFHDGPDFLHAAISELDFIEHLQKERLLRYRISKAKPSFITRLFMWIRKAGPQA